MKKKIILKGELKKDYNACGDEFLIGDKNTYDIFMQLLRKKVKVTIEFEQKKGEKLEL